MFVDVTADWCLNCKWNKANVVNQDVVQELFKKHNVKVVTVDYTQKSPSIQQYIKSYGRVGIPMNLVYGPGVKEPVLLPVFLTTQAVIQAVEKAEGNKSRP